MEVLPGVSTTRLTIPSINSALILKKLDFPGMCDESFFQGLCPAKCDACGQATTQPPTDAPDCGDVECDDGDDGGQNENDFDDGELNDTPRDDDIYIGNDGEVDDP
jgi:hypothetical protein